MTESLEELSIPPKSTTPIVETKNKGSIDHLAISESLGYQIFRKTKKNKWSQEEDEALKQYLIEQFVQKKNLEKFNNERIDPDVIDWVLVSNKLVTRKAKECKKRWMGSLDPYLRKGKWTKEEDNLLVKAYKKYGPSWQKIACEIEGRNDDQCSKRYTEVLHSDTSERLKTWSLDEDKTLIEGVKTYGTKWRTIATSLPGRPSLTCRNRWRKIMTDVARDTACEEIKKAVGVLDGDGKPLILFKKEEKKTKTLPPKSIASPTESLKRRSNFDNNEQKRSKIEDFKSSASNSPKVFSPPISSIRYGTPTQNTEWKFSLVDPNSSEEIPSFSGPVSNNEIAQKLVELAKVNGVNITVHQHIHHHYSSSSNIPHDPQSNVNRYSHFNYLPPLTEVPKLTSSSSAENTVESNGSNKNSDPSLIKLLNNGNINRDEKFNDKDFPRSTRQQLFPSANISTSRLSSPAPLMSPVLAGGSTTVEMESQKSNMNEKPKQKSSNYLTEDLEEELDFWDAMRSITQPRPSSAKPVSQHHPLHYSQPSTYKSQSPYQTSDSYGVSRFPNMASPLITDSSSYKRTVPSVSNITNRVNRPVNYGGIYATGNDDEEDDDEEEDMDIANQYGIYYSVLQGNTNDQQNGQNTPNSLVGSGYLMPFNPS